MCEEMLESTVKTEPLKRLVNMLHLWVHSSTWAMLRWQRVETFRLEVSQHNLCINNCIITKQQSWMKDLRKVDRKKKHKEKVWYEMLVAAHYFAVESRRVNWLLKQSKRNKTNNPLKDKTESRVATWYCLQCLIFKQKI